MFKFLFYHLTENSQIKTTVEAGVVASATVNSFDLFGFIDLLVNPFLQAISLILTIVLSILMIHQRLKKGAKNAVKIPRKKAEKEKNS